MSWIRIDGNDETSWSLHAERDYGGIVGLSAVFGPTRFFLDINLIPAEAYEITSGPARGYPSMTGSANIMHVRNIEVTAEEATRIANGTHPRDVLLFPECGWRLAVVPDPLLREAM